MLGLYNSTKLIWILEECYKFGTKPSWMAVEIGFMISGLSANLLLAWVFIKDRKEMSPSKVLGVNLVVMDLLFLMSYPASISLYVQEKHGHHITAPQANTSGSSTTDHGPTLQYVEVMTVCNVIGCPLLLACMCMERYAAVARPLLYLRARTWELKAAVSAAVWTVTLAFGVAVGKLTYNGIIIPINLTLSALFLVMFSCLVGVAWSLWQPSPAHSAAGQPLSSPPPATTLKRRALRTVLAVMLPSVASYVPVLLFMPLVMHINVNPPWCTVLEVVLFCPSLGVFIGPLFYLAKAQELLCGRKGRMRGPPG